MKSNKTIAITGTEMALSVNIRHKGEGGTAYEIVMFIQALYEALQLSFAAVLLPQPGFPPPLLPTHPPTYLPTSLRCLYAAVAPVHSP